ncbi:MAG: hypothetical protein KGZ88_00130 [Methylomicrobium sp.]|nr:hypothetical protein [Methylomicrobium sp.]
MKKRTCIFILLSLVFSCPVANAQPIEASDPGFVLLDVLFYRPLGFAATVVGTGLFIGISPLTALASIPHPHDAFIKTGNILVLAPGAYTFIRPLGDRRFPYVPPSYKHKRIVSDNDVPPK